MSEIRIENEPLKLLAKIDQADRGEFTSDEACVEILASAIFLSALNPSNDLRPQVLLVSLVEKCGWPLTAQWATSWALGRQSVFGTAKAKAIPVIRDHVQRLEDAWRKNFEQKVADTKEWFAANTAAAGEDDP